MRQLRERQRGALSAFTLVLLGSLLVQGAWVLVVPPFRGLDEHDHSFKAAAVAQGDWSPRHRASEQGWGEFVAVPKNLVVAAQPVCETFPYTTTDNCRPGSPVDDGLVLVASSASRYNPVFYFAIGWPAQGLSGTSSLYAMRAAGALLCSILVALAAVATRRWARTCWPAVSFTLAATPMMMYSTAIAAPNGIEVAGALLVWSALLGLVREPEHRPPRFFLWMATLGAIPLVGVRSLGPLWMVLVVLVVAVLVTHTSATALLRSRTAWSCVSVVVTTIAAAIGWTVWADTNSPGSAPSVFDPPTIGIFVQNWVLWFFQSIAAFPARDELAPLSLYAIALVAWWTVLALAMTSASRRERWAAGLVMLLASLVPLTAMDMTYEQLGAVWQGRYGYPLAMGAILISGLALDRRSSSIPRSSWPLWVAGVVFAATQLIGQLHVLGNQTRTSPLVSTGEWAPPNPWLVAVLVAIGGLMWVGGLRPRLPGKTKEPPL